MPWRTCTACAIARCSTGWALSRCGYDRLTALIPTDSLYRHPLVGLDIKPLGLAADRDGLKQVAVIVRVTAESLAGLQLALNVPEPQVHYVGAPFGDALVLGPVP